MELVDKEKLLKDITGNCIAARIRVMDRAISSIYNKAVRPHGLRITQMNIIVIVAAYGPMEVKPLCRILNMDSSTMSRALVRIEKMSHLKSEPSGQGKNIIISVTNKGLDLLQRVYPDWKKAEEEVMELFGQETVMAIRGAGDKLLLAAMTKFSV
ncbi:MAG TPA: MarR family winged helix-turn-helix transcriptional regulator [Bacteroidales bacterium]|nr:MarR family winged helix-turn-helix transcriptional regulator [Bacteroidales bacterium]HKK68708.1 MarR family winged helix-turn-helix transcriptional regulator [Bacteroidales bacterium]